MNKKETWFSVLTHCSVILSSTEFSLVVLSKHDQKASLEELDSQGSLCSSRKDKFPLREFHDITAHPDLCPGRASPFPSLSFNFLVRWGKGKYLKLFFSHCVSTCMVWHRNPSPKWLKSYVSGKRRGWEQGQASGSPSSKLTSCVSGTVQLLHFFLLIFPLQNAS